MRKLTQGEAIEIGKRLNEAIRQSTPKSQRQLQNSLKINQSQLSKILRGQFRCASKHVVRLSKEYDINIDFLNHPATKSQLFLNRPKAQPATQHGTRAATGAGISTQTTKSPETAVIDAFKAIWDGTPGHITAVQALILATKDLTRQAGTAITTQGGNYV
jgi:plasmid maintenance system antidote protein VapI